MAVYNRQDYVSRAIESVLSQTYRKWELIAVDDGSQDNSVKILDKFHLQYPRVKVVRQNHRFLPATRNMGIRKSGGDFITFLDSDDEFLKDHIEFRIDYLLKHPEIDLIHGGVKIIGDEYVPDKDDKNKLIHISQCTVGATFFGKKKVFLKLKGFKDVQYSEDSEFIERAVKQFNVKKIEYPTYIYHRDTPQSITKTISQTGK